MKISKKTFEKLMTPNNIMSLIALIVVIIVSVYFINKIRDEIEGDEYYSAGEFSKYYLKGDKYTEVIIEIDAVEGFKPDDDAINTLKTRVSENCDKQKIEIDKSSYNIIPQTKSKYYIDDILNLEKEYRNRYRKGNTIVLYYIYLNGQNGDNSDVVGQAYSASSCVIFKERIQEASNNSGLITEEDIEKAVVVHEFGHILSLVNIGYKSDIDHEDSDYPHHCTHEAYFGGLRIYDCNMYWAIETTAISTTSAVNQLTGIPDDFCEYCKHDLELIKKDQENRDSEINDVLIRNSKIAVDSSIYIPSKFY